ncbi:hypothetical protein V6N13_001977 [Hibiscus sabdariffa]
MVNGDDEYEASPHATNSTPSLGMTTNVTLQKKSSVLESHLALTMAHEPVPDDHAIKVLVVEVVIHDDSLSHKAKGVELVILP